MQQGPLRFRRLASALLWSSLINWLNHSTLRFRGPRFANDPGKTIFIYPHPRRRISVASRYLTRRTCLGVDIWQIVVGGADLLVF